MTPFMAGFVDELVKTAKSAPTAKDRKRRRRAVAAGLGTAFGVQTAAGLAALPTISPARKGRGVEVETAIKNYAKRMGLKKKVTFIRGISPMHLPPGVKPHRKEHKVIGPGRMRRAVLLHELGHGKTVERLGRLGLPFRIGQGSLRLGGSLAFLPMAGVAAAQKDPTWVPGAIQAGLFAPTLADEALASRHATKQLMKEYGPVKGLRKALRLIPGLGTYLTTALTPLAITAWRKRKKRLQEERFSRPRR